MELFEQAARQARQEAAPLADRVRPRRLEELVGQTHLLGEGRLLRVAIERGDLHSMILWGPPGTGKTTLASLVAERAHALIRVADPAFRADLTRASERLV